MAVQARIKNRAGVIKTFRKHLKNGTFPKRMKSIKPYPKMGFPEAQAVVNVPCNQVQCVILDQMLQEQEKKLLQDQDQYQTLKEERLKDQKLTHVKPLKKPTVPQLQKELAEIQAKYSEVCNTLENLNKPQV